MENKLKSIRKLRGITQQQMADALREKIATYRTREHGTTNLSIVRLVNCARILDCSTVDLLLPRMTWSVPWNGEARLMRSRIRLV